MGFWPTLTCLSFLLALPISSELSEIPFVLGWRATVKRLSGSPGVAWVALQRTGEIEMVYLGLHKKCTAFPGPSLSEPV